MAPDEAGAHRARGALGADTLVVQALDPLAGAMRVHLALDVLFADLADALVALGAIRVGGAAGLGDVDAPALDTELRRAGALLRARAGDGSAAVAPVAVTTGDGPGRRHDEKQRCGHGP